MPLSDISYEKVSNSAGSLRTALSDWRTVRRFHVGTGHTEPTTDAGYTTACASDLPDLSISFIAFRGSPYRMVRAHFWHRFPDND